MADADAPTSPKRYARALGVIGGAAVAVIAAGLIWGVGVAPWLRPGTARTLTDGFGVLAVLAFLPVLGLLLGIGIHACVDSLRRATGSPAARLGFFFAVLAGLSVFGWDASRNDGYFATAGLAALAAVNVVPWWLFRRRGGPHASERHDG